MLAILAAVAVAAFQHSKDQARQEELDRKERTRVVSLISECAADLCQFVFDAGQVDHRARAAGLAGLDGGSRGMLRDKVLVLRRQLESFVPAQMPSPQSFRLLVRLQSRVDLLLEDLGEPHRVLGWIGDVHFASHYGHARQLVDEVQFELRRIADPSAVPPWAP